MQAQNKNNSFSISIKENFLNFVYVVIAIPIIVLAIAAFFALYAYIVLSALVNLISHALAILVKSVSFILMCIDSQFSKFFDNKQGVLIFCLKTIHEAWFLFVITIWCLSRTCEQLAALLKLPLFNTLLTYIALYTGPGWDDEKKSILKLRDNYDKEIIDTGRFNFLWRHNYLDSCVFGANTFYQKVLDGLEIDYNDDKGYSCCNERKEYWCASDLQTKTYDVKIKNVELKWIEYISKFVDVIRFIIEVFFSPIRKFNSFFLAYSIDFYNKNNPLYVITAPISILSTLLFGADETDLRWFNPDCSDDLDGCCAFLLGLLNRGLVFLAFEPLKFLGSKVFSVFLFILAEIFRPFVAGYNIIFSNQNDHDRVSEYEGPTTPIKNDLCMPANLFILENKISKIKEYDNPLTQFEKPGLLYYDCELYQDYII